MQPGRDGVGDYCRKLGSELSRLGHQILLISLNELYLRSPGHEMAEGFSVLRCGLHDSLCRRLELSRRALEQFCPDWVSLQYVCYGYHPKGLAWGWNPIFAELGKTGPRRHLMLHELWSGEGGHPPLRHRLLGLGQRWSIVDLYRRFRPDVVTTTIRLYQRRLARRGMVAEVVPLFGNIRTASIDNERIARILCEAGSRLAQNPRPEFVNGIFFGTIHPDFNAAPLIKWLEDLRTRARKPVLLTMIGRSGAAAGGLAKQIMKARPDAVEVIALGEQSEEIISQALQFAEFGINTGSPAFLGKSGTFAAMQEHGLPVVLADGELDATCVGEDVPPVVQFSTPNSVTRILSGPRIINPTSKAPQTAENLMHLFKNAEGARSLKIECNLLKT